MRKIINGILFIAILIPQSCSEKYPEPCFSPPSGFLFEIVDKSTGENLFTNGTYSPDSIEVINIETQSAVEFTFIDENDYNVIRIGTIGWKTEAVNYSLNIGSNSIFELYVDADRLRGDRCEYTVYNEVQIRNTEYTQDQYFEFFKIFVD